MTNYIFILINNFGYFGMFLGMVLEAVIIVIPSELILATGGILASQGIFNFWITFLVGLLGSVFCAIVIYFMGYDVKGNEKVQLEEVSQIKWKQIDDAIEFVTFANDKEILKKAKKYLELNERK